MFLRKILCKSTKAWSNFLLSFIFCKIVTTKGVAINIKVIHILIVINNCKILHVSNSYTKYSIMKLTNCVYLRDYSKEKTMN